MQPHDPKDEDDEVDDCTLPVAPLPSPLILSDGDSGVDGTSTSLVGVPTIPFSPKDVVAEEHEVTPDGEAEDEDGKPQKAWGCCFGILMLIILWIYEVSSVVANGLGSQLSDYLSHLH